MQSSKKEYVIRFKNFYLYNQSTWRMALPDISVLKHNIHIYLGTG